MNHIRSNIATMTGYEYGEQPDDPTVIKLNTNENPYPPSSRVKQVLEDLDIADLRRYPEPTARSFRALVGKRFGVAPTQVVATNGGDEGIRLVLNTFLDPSELMVTTDPGYSLYSVFAAIQGCRSAMVELDDDFELQPEELLRAHANQAKLVCLVNPHAPSGRLMSVDRISHIASELQGILLVDEAYVDFVDPKLRHNLVELLREHRNLLLLRTLSKGYSLAGLRLGFLMGDEELIEPIATKTRDSYNVDAIAQLIGCAALADTEFVGKNVAKVRAQRAALRNNLEKLGFNVVDSQTNFLLVRHPTIGNLKKTYLELKERKVLVRYFDTPRMRGCFRVTVGTPEENQTLLEALSAITST